MSTAQIEYIAFLATMGLLTIALTVGLDRVFRRRPQGRDVGLAVFVEDPTEEPCPVCEGDEFLTDEMGSYWEPCFMCAERKTP